MSRLPHSFKTGFGAPLGTAVGATVGATVAAAAIALGARLAAPLPGTDVPQTAQTLAVLLVGIILGRVWGPAAVVLYLVAGALGLPVFADGKSGPGVLAGPTAGYLAGFVGAAWIAGAWAHRGLGRRLPSALAGMLLAHGVILLLGWARLALAIGTGRAFAAGVAPFLVGGAAKSLLAAIACVFVSRQRTGQIGSGSTLPDGP